MFLHGREVLAVAVRPISIPVFRRVTDLRSVGQSLALFHGLHPEHALHLGHSEFVHRVVTIRLPERIVCTDKISALGERPSLLHIGLRGVETGAPEMELILHVRWVGSHGKCELLSGLVPLLRILIIQATPEILLALFGERRHRHAEYANGKDKGN